MTTIVRPQLTKYEEPILDRRLNCDFEIITITASNGLYRFIVLDSKDSHLIEVSTDTGARLYKLEGLTVVDIEIGGRARVIYSHTGVYNTRSSLKYLRYTLQDLNDIGLMNTIYGLASSADPLYMLCAFNETFVYLTKFILLSRDFDKLLALLPDRVSFRRLKDVFTSLARDYLNKFGGVLSKSDLEDKSFYDYLITTGVTTEKLQGLLDLLGAGIYDMIPPIKGATKHIAVPLPDILLSITFPKNKSTLEGVNIHVLGNNVEQLPLTNLFETYRYKEDDLNELKYLPEPLKSHLKYRNYRKYCKGNFFKFDKNYKTTMEGLNAALAAVRSFLFTHSNKDLYDHSKTSAVVKHSWPAVKVTNLDNVEIE